MHTNTSKQSIVAENRQEWRRIRRICLLVLFNLLVFMGRDVNVNIHNIRMYGTYATTAYTHTHTHSHSHTHTHTHTHTHCYHPGEALIEAASREKMSLHQNYDEHLHAA